MLSAVNGFVYFTEGAARPGRNAAARDIVLERGKLQLARVRPIRDVEYELGPEVHRVTFERHPTPIVLIPPLMVRPYVYDLRPEHSMVRTLRNAGFDVYVVDFGVPDRDDEGVRLDDYVLDYVPRCIDAALETSGAQSVTLAGYCMGGIFGLMHAGTHRRRARAKPGHHRCADQLHEDARRLRRLSHRRVRHRAADGRHRTTCPARPAAWASS